MVYGQFLYLLGEFFRNSMSPSQMLTNDTFLQILPTQEGSGLCPLLTIRLAMYLRIQIFVPPHTILYVVILSGDRWNSRTKIHLK
ncbi:hypothetical protein AVEN_57127-1 [Araneus ventricosus]|uniref:Uncharacterized protein n=1 Tax=Araneus ventricosus TaxID=182803 RepID=A0A4Y2H7Z2_ARAVE|nr:hypothetical protein AVEN_57127-1 [Araneus ventricosus]